ncbi:MAG: hypothetical protein HQL93_09665 [Magnetococcales bacterium]|nr:hypothetical protein [Magnetococcales bacterium]
MSIKQKHCLTEHNEPCNSLVDLSQQLLALTADVKQGNAQTARIEINIAQINENLTKLINHSVRIDRLENDHATYQAGRKEVWDVLRAVEKTAQQALTLSSDLKDSTIEDRKTIRQAAGWLITIALAAAGGVWTMWQGTTAR